MRLAGLYEGPEEDEMRLLPYSDDGSLTLTKYDGDNPPPYATLSHTWGSDAGADTNAQNWQQNNALLMASINGYREVVQVLPDAGADMDRKEPWMATRCRRCHEAATRE